MLELIGDTRIRLLDGTKPKIKELADDNPSNECLLYWLYSMEDNNLVPGLGYNPCVSGSTDTIVRVTLDDASTINCSMNTLFYNLNGNKVLPTDLAADDSLWVRYFEYHDIFFQRDGDYEFYYDPMKNQWIKTHWMVSDILPNAHPGSQDWHRHHMDMNPRNNSPYNLVWLTRSEHAKIHFRAAAQSEEGRERARKTGRKTGAKNLSAYNRYCREHGRYVQSNLLKSFLGSERQKEGLRQRNKDPKITKLKIRGRITSALAAFLNENIEFNKDNYENFRSSHKKHSYPRYDTILLHFDSYEEALEEAKMKQVKLAKKSKPNDGSHEDYIKYKNHKISNIEILHLDTPVILYTMSTYYDNLLIECDNSESGVLLSTN